MPTKDFNWKTLIAVGLLAGLAQVASGVAMYLTGFYFVTWSMFVSLSVLMLCIVLGTRWYAVSHLKRQITFGEALVIGIVISVTTGIVYAIYNIISISFFYPNFLEDTFNIYLASVPVSRRNSESIAAIRESVTTNKIAFGNLIRLSLLGTVLSVFASFLVSRRYRTSG